MKNIGMAAISALLMIVLTGCASSGAKVTYQDPSAVETVTADFGSTDLHMIAEKMVNSLIDSPVLEGRPVVVVLKVKNRTTEHVDTKAITDKIRTTLLKSGKVRFTSSNDIRNDLLDQLEFQNSNLVDPSTGVQYGKIVGAKFALHGEITSIVKQAGRVKDVWFKINLELSNLENGLLEWADDKEIRKEAKRRTIGW